MNKKEFLKQIKIKLKDFNYVETEKILEYYDELINDYMEGGMNEEEAVASLGDIEDIVNKLKADLVIERSKNKNTNSLKNFIIILSICTSPVLIPLGISFFITFLVLIFSMIIVFFSFAGSALLILFASIYTTIEMIVTGVDAATILMSLGIQLFAGSLLGLLSVGIFEVSKLLLNFLNKQFSKFIKKKSKKEIKVNV